MFREQRAKTITSIICGADWPIQLRPLLTDLFITHTEVKLLDATLMYFHAARCVSHRVAVKRDRDLMSLDGSEKQIYH